MEAVKGAYVIWQRDLLRFWRNKARVLTGMSFPILWLLIFGNGISASLSLPVPGVKFVQFLFPGIISQFMIFMASFAAVSILQDREFGFLKEILVSPIPRVSIALGKVIGGATTATLQSLTILILAPLVGIHLTLRMVLELLPATFLLALMLSAFGVTLVSRLKSIDSGQYIFQFVTFPLVFLSGAVFPLVNLPRWLDIATKLNPVTYGVDMLRKIVFTTSNLPPAAITHLSPKLFDKPVSIHTDLLIVGSITLLFVAISSLAFTKSD